MIEGKWVSLQRLGYFLNNKIRGVFATVDEVTGIQSLIPNQASEENQLADKAFVNSSVQTATANFRGNWSTWSDVPTNSSLYPIDYTGSKVPTVNDYLVVQDASDYTTDSLEGTWRFKYSGVWATNGKNGWNPEYQVNEEPLTSAQIAALNSGATSAIISSIGNKQDTLVSGTNIKTINNQTLLGSGNIEISSGGTYVEGAGIDISNNTISVESSIISGATSGSTAVQPSAITDMATKTWVTNQGYLTDYTETDPIFSASAASGITSTNINSWNNKQDKISDLSTIRTNAGNGATAYTNLNGHTVESNVPNNAKFTDTVYDDTEVRGLINGKQATLVSGTNIKTVNGNSLLGSGNVSISGGDTVNQVAEDEDKELYPILFKWDADNSQEIAATHYSTKFTISPRTGDISTNGSVSATGFVDNTTGDNTHVWTTNGGKIELPKVSTWLDTGDGIQVSTDSSGDFVALTWDILGQTTVSSVASIPTTYKHVLANVSDNATLSFSALPLLGNDVNVIIHNTGSSTITITLPNSGNYVCTAETTIHIAAGLYGEVNVVNINNKGYVRGVSSI